MNKQKCLLQRREIKFFGFIFSADGLKPDPEKIRALRDSEQPKNASEMRSFLGMAQYSSRFIQNFATLTQPLRQLTHQDTPWRWGRTEESAFLAVKLALCESTRLAYFDMKKKTEIIVDASPVGLAALLIQENRPICYASRALSDVEQRYSQTEREALSVIWACEHFDVFIRGSKVAITTDHRALLTIWNKPNPPARIARWALRLQPYQIEMKYTPGKNNPADYLSRHPTQECLSSREEIIAENFVNFLATTSTPKAMSVEEVQSETEKDQTLQKVIEMVRTNNWHSAIPDDTLSKAEIESFRNVKDSLCYNAPKNVLLKDNVLVIPQSLRARVIQLAHEGHQGINKTKALIRSKVWFPGINKAVEAAINTCIPCQVNSTRFETTPLSMTPLPPGPWLHLSIDFCGPLPTGESLLVIIDKYSRYPIVEVMRDTSAEAVIPVVDKIFSVFGYPERIKSDNGPQFISSLWKNFLEECGVKHRKITPLWPRANAQAENFNKPLLKAIRAAHAEGLKWKPQLIKFLHNYRTTPHSTTLFSPFFLLFGREPRTKLPNLTTQPHPQDQLARSQDEQAKQRIKRHADMKEMVKHRELLQGDRVLIRQNRRNKLSTKFSPVPLTVTQVKGHMITARRPDGSHVTRNVSFFRKLHPSTPVPRTFEEEESIPDWTREPHPQEIRQEEEENPRRPRRNANESIPRRSGRTRRQPAYLQDYI